VKLAAALLLQAVIYLAIRKERVEPLPVFEDDIDWLQEWTGIWERAA
jgi:hypothetical protein